MLKDKYNISDTACKALTSISDLPTFYAISQIIQKANVILPIQRTPGEEPGIQRDLRELLKIKINNFVDSGKFKKEGGSGEGSSEIHVKISGDGTQVGHTSNFVNITCTHLYDTETANSPEGQEPIAIIAASEKYEILKTHLADIANSTSTFTLYTYNGITFNIIYYLGGDYKFLLCMLGLMTSANSSFPCIK